MFEELGSLASPPSPLVGRARIITQVLVTAVEDLFTEDSDLHLDEICTWLAVEHNITITTSSLFFVGNGSEFYGHTTDNMQLQLIEFDLVVFYWILVDQSASEGCLILSSSLTFGAGESENCSEIYAAQQSANDECFVSAIAAVELTVNQWPDLVKVLGFINTSGDTNLKTFCI
ncbi:hypothetical protein BDR07DRAFT_1486751 [Suillus spraguei]|nr:hypothetical protein BDR07DRAFT_1486751 [Suillus spraguei]